VQALNSDGYDRSPIGVLVRDAKMLARLNFSSVSFVFYRRDCNKAAHAMAALGASSSAANVLLWLDDVPNNVSVIVASDLAMPLV
jgi:hypothetical protein